VLGVSFDTVEENADFADKFSFPFPLLCDTARSVGLAYGACDDASAGYAKRIAYLIDEQGHIQHAWTKADPANHPTELLALLN
jgi:peroxiredoxin Q/BCP